MPPRSHSQPIALPAAAAIAYQQLAPTRPPRFYDGEHLSEVLCLVAQALLRVAPVQVDDAGQRRLLTEEELHGLVVSRGATRITLHDGRIVSEAVIGRQDLRDAIVILRATGLELLLRSAAPTLKG
jgi:hypothetical protein